MSHPEPKLHPGPWWYFMPHILFLLLRMITHLFWLLTIFSNVFSREMVTVGLHFQRDLVVERGDCLVTFIYLNIAYLIFMIRGYRSVEFPPPPTFDEEKSQEASMATELRTQLQRPKPDPESNITGTDFAAYVVNPYFSHSGFSRRQQASSFSMCLVLNLLFARLPFREWSKIDDAFPASADGLFQFLGLLLTAGWGGWFMLSDALLEGWSVRMGGIARGIRRGCLRVDGGEGEAIESLEWWVGEILRDVDSDDG